MIMMENKTTTGIKIFLIENDNGGIYEDHYTWIEEKAFTSIDDARQMLIDQGYSESESESGEIEFEKECTESFSCFGTVYARILTVDLIGSIKDVVEQKETC